VDDPRGLFLYDHLARREVLPASRTVDLRRHEAGAPLQPRFTKGFVYSDGWVDDARLVALNAIDAASAARRCSRAGAARRAARGDGLAGDAGQPAANAHAEGARAGQRRRAVGRAVPGRARAPAARPKALRLVKGSHIVVPKLFEHQHAYIFQNPDKRIIFAIPYEHDFTLIGTTDVEHHGAITR
jgi:glycerol-3-phosphate dehydrogenase